MARLTERLYHLQPWAQRRGADGTEVRDGSDDSAREQGARARCSLLIVRINVVSPTELLSPKCRNVFDSKEKAKKCSAA